MPEEVCSSLPGTFIFLFRAGGFGPFLVFLVFLVYPVYPASPLQSKSNFQNHARPVHLLVGHIFI